MLTWEHMKCKMKRAFVDFRLTVARKLMAYDTLQYFMQVVEMFSFGHVSVFDAV